jgi:hypothetical protein
MPAARRLLIVEDKTGKVGPELRGAALDLFRCLDPEVVIAGPAETGKTFAAVHKLHVLLSHFAGAQAVLVRKVKDTIHGTVLQTYTKKILRPDGQGGYVGVQAYGGERPQWFDYDNGSRLRLAGMDDPGKVLSAEHDFIYVNQAEELTLDDWQVLTTRATGRAGHAPYGQVLGDCNPGPPHHWILNRPTLRVFHSRHEDNPSLYDAALRGWTDQGRRTLAVLDALTGVRRERLFRGKWVSAEGTVYEFDPRVHLLPRGWVPPKEWPRARSVDFGFTNPFSCGWWAIDPDGRLYRYREIYMTGRTVRVHAGQIKALSTGEQYLATVADTDAEDRATLDECGIPTIPADKDISPGVQAVQERLKVRGDGKPRIYFVEGCLVERDETLAERHLPVCARDEWDVYVWPKGADGKPVKEVPVDLNNHAMDETRYMVRWADTRQRVGSYAPLPAPRNPRPTVAGGPTGQFRKGPSFIGRR